MRRCDWMFASGEAGRKIKAALCIAMLAGAEVQHAQREIHLKAPSTSSSSAARATAPMHDWQLKSAMDAFGVEEWAKHFAGMLADSNFQNLWTSPAEQVEHVLRDPIASTHIERIAEHLEGMMANPNFQRQAKLVAEQIGALADRRVKEQMEFVANEVESMIAKMDSEKISSFAMFEDPNFKGQATRIAEQIRVMMASPSFLKEAKLVAERVDALMAAPVTDELTKRHTTDTQNPRINANGLTDRLVSSLFDLALRSHPATHAINTRARPKHFPSDFVASAARWKRLEARAPRSGTSIRAMNDESGSQAAASMDQGFILSRWFDINTRGGVLVWSLVLSLGMYGAKSLMVSIGIEDVMANSYVGALFVLVLFLAWSGLYVFRVNTKQMTYVKQLNAYEEAVMQKRLEELSESDLAEMMQTVEEEEKQREARRQAAQKERQEAGQM